MAEEVVLMKGNEAIAHAAIRYGVDGYFGYPITPQSEVLETLAELKPWETTGMVVLQAESAGTGKMVMTSSSSPGVSLKQEGISYIAGAELPCLVVNVMRGGPGLGTIQPSQADYFQTTKGGGHGDYHVIALAPGIGTGNGRLRRLGFRISFQIPQPGYDSCRWRYRPDDGKSGIARTSSAPHRRRNHRSMPVGSYRTQRTQAECHHFA